MHLTDNRSCPRVTLARHAGSGSPGHNVLPKDPPMAWLLKKSRVTLNPSRRRFHLAPVDITRIQNQSLREKCSCDTTNYGGKVHFYVQVCPNPPVPEPSARGSINLFQASALAINVRERTEEEVEDGRSEQHFTSRDMPRVLWLQNARSRTRTATFVFPEDTERRHEVPTAIGKCNG